MSTGRQNVRFWLPTGSFGLPWCWHPRVSCLLHGGLSPLRRTWSRVHGAGDEREPRPGRPDAAGPQGWIPDGRDAGRVHGDPGRSGPGGRTPARDHPAGAPGTSRWGSPVRSRSPGRRRCGCPARPHPNPAVTLSDMGGRGERSPSRRSVRRRRRLSGWLRTSRTGCSGASALAGLLSAAFPVQGRSQASRDGQRCAG